MAAVTGTPVTAHSEPVLPPTPWESAGCQKTCATLSRLGVGADMRLCCRPWTRDERVLAGIARFVAESAISALFGVVAMLVSWFWNSTALIAIAISSAVDLLRNLGYCWQARAGLSGPGGLPPSVFVTWTVSILLHFAAIGCSSYVMNVVENLDDVTREEAELFEPLFWAGCICSIVGPLASVSVALSAAGDVKPQVVADFARRTPGEGATDTRPLLNV